MPAELILMLLVLTGSRSTRQAPAEPDQPSMSMSALRNFLPGIRGMTPDFRSLAFTDSDLVVGYPDTVEARTIHGNYSHAGRILVLNHGTLVLDHADFALSGDICIWGNGKLIVRGGTFAVVQHYAYQYSATIADHGLLQFDSVRVSFSGQSWGASLLDAAQMVISHTTQVNGFATLSPQGMSRVACVHSRFPSEYIVFDSSEVRLEDSRTALLWLGFPYSCHADVTLPWSDTTIRHWAFPDRISSAAGVGYRIVLDSVDDVMWGAFPRQECRASFRDRRSRHRLVVEPAMLNSRAQASGSIFGAFDVLAVAGLAGVLAEPPDTTRRPDIGWLAGPTLALTTVNRQSTKSIGLRAGLVFERQFLVGMGICGINERFTADSGGDRRPLNMWYAGLNVEYPFVTLGPLDVRAATLVGGGEIRQPPNGSGVGIDRIAVLEPRIGATCGVLGSFRVGIELGYRRVLLANLLDNSAASGFTSSVFFDFGHN